MKNKLVEIVIIVVLTLFISSCIKPITYDLAIENVNVFDSNNKRVLENKTILINADTIAGIVNSNVETNAKERIEGNGRLVTSGFVDTHIHLTNVYGDYENAPERLAEDSLTYYRQQLSDTYLKYGTTTIRVAGQPENWIVPTLNWQNNPSPEYPDIYISGGALISNQEQKAYLNHVIVTDTNDARDKILEYYDLGIRHIKLYSKLQQDDFRAALKKAQDLGMNVCAHIDRNIMFIDTAMKYGLKHFEHTFTPIMTVFRYDTHWMEYLDYMHQRTRVDQGASDFFVFTMEVFGYVYNHEELNKKLNSLIEEMGHQNVTICSTIHLFAEKTGRTYFKNPSEFNDTLAFPEKHDFNRYKDNFDILMKYTKKMHDAGVKLTIGTDCKNGGKAALSEMLLFYEAGFSIEDILQIATINGAQALDLESSYGSIESGKKANLVIFEESPFKNSKNFLSDKVVIKDGKIYKK